MEKGKPDLEYIQKQTEKLSTPRAIKVNQIAEMVQDAVGGCSRHWAMLIACYLVDHGVEMRSFEIGDRVRIKGHSGVWEVTAIHYYKEGEPQISVTSGKITNTMSIKCLANNSYWVDGLMG